MPSACCPEAARKFFASHGQRVAVHRLVFMRVAPVLRGSGEIQLVQPDGFGGNDPDGEDDHGKRAPRAKRDFIRLILPPDFLRQARAPENFQYTSSMTTI